MNDGRPNSFATLVVSPILGIVCLLAAFVGVGSGVLALSALAFHTLKPWFNTGVYVFCIAITVFLACAVVLAVVDVIGRKRPQ